MTLTTEKLRNAITSIHKNITPIGEELNELDGRLGDGDLGVTLVNGFKNVATISSDLPNDFGMALFECAKAITKVSGSSFGTLMATALMAAGKSVRGETRLDWNKTHELLVTAQKAMISRGGASLGDKTLLDSIDAIIQSIDGLNTPDEILMAAKDAVNKALSEYNQKPNRIGRARIFGDKTIGIDDPGMVAVKRMVDCLG